MERGSSHGSRGRALPRPRPARQSPSATALRNLLPAVGASRAVASEHVAIPYRRQFPYPLPAVYAWLTDYQDDDAEKAGAIIRRRSVVSREPGRIVLEGELETLGRRAPGRAEVLLHPPDRWEARFLAGPLKGSVYEYRLTPVAPGRTRLDALYRARARRPSRRLLIRLLRPFIRREIHRMWNGFAKAMDADLAPLPK